MFEADDSAGATEAEVVDQDVSENSTEVQDVAEGSAETTDDNEAGLVTYEIGEIQATEAEIKSWREAYDANDSKNKDYTQKTQALAADRKALEQIREKSTETLEFLEGMVEELDGVVMGDLKDIDLAQLIEEDPAQYERTKQKIESKKRWRDDFQKKLNDKRDEAIGKAQEFLYKKMEWVGNEAKFKDDVKAIEEQAKVEGISQAGFAKISEPGVMTALIKANKYDQLMAKKEAVAKQVKKAPTVASPKASANTAPKTLAQRMYPNMK